MQKLVRDKIPEIMVASGISPVVTILQPDERLRWLLLKLSEETAELTCNPNLEECADVYEVLISIAAELGHTVNDVASAAQNKNDARGGFASGIILTIRDDL